MLMTISLFFLPLFLLKLAMVGVGGALAYGAWRDWNPLFAIGPGKKLQKRMGHGATRIAYVIAGAMIAFLGVAWLLP